MSLPPPCLTCGHTAHGHGRFYGRRWSEHCRTKGCSCPHYIPRLPGDPEPEGLVR